MKPKGLGTPSNADQFGLCVLFEEGECQLTSLTGIRFLDAGNRVSGRCLGACLGCVVSWISHKWPLTAKAPVEALLHLPNDADGEESPSEGFSDPVLRPAIYAPPVSRHTHVQGCSSNR